MSDSKSTESEYNAIEDFSQFIEAVRQVQSLIRHIALPEYLTDDEREEWRQLLNSEEHGWKRIDDKACTELYREEWYE